MKTNEVKSQVAKLVTLFSAHPKAEWHSMIKKQGNPFGGEKNPLRRKTYDIMSNSIEDGAYFIVFTSLMVDKDHLVVESDICKQVFYKNDFKPFMKCCKKY